MYTLATKDQSAQGPFRPFKRPLIWLGVSLGCFGIANLYALFGHGVRSDAMDFMFLYPLLGGALVYLFYDRIAGNNAGYGRLATNMYNSGIATLAAGGMLRGILEIAGTASAYSIVFTLAGWGLVAVGAVIGIVSVASNRSE